MIEITPPALEKLLAHLKENKLEPQIRVTLGCCGEGRLILTPEKVLPGDLASNFGPLTIGLSRDAAEMGGRVRIDFRTEGEESGFVVEAERRIDSADGCAGCTSCG